ncbi:MAG: hypothetical protein M9905_04235 [Rhizobiaceae bacterium]|nr:hypothetical protein [Rhizobiaceae bacterium]
MTKLTLQTLATSGAIAGLVGAIAVFGIHHRYVDGMLVQPLSRLDRRMSPSCLSAYDPVAGADLGLLLRSDQAGRRAWNAPPKCQKSH